MNNTTRHTSGCPRSVPTSTHRSRVGSAFHHSVLSVDELVAARTRTAHHVARPSTFRSTHNTQHALQMSVNVDHAALERHGLTSEEQLAVFAYMQRSMSVRAYEVQQHIAVSDDDAMRWR